ncbi:DUF2752 domain-containing protein [Streptomyces sp. Qhu_M48]|uniref:DUF2752 domain-containing protein n=1 Tax=Streptomyces sp. Qhu_M48 TaxID=3435889 RepID=UPI003F5018CC
MDPQPTAGAVTDASSTRPGEPVPPGEPARQDAAAHPVSPDPRHAPAWPPGHAEDHGPVPPPHAPAWPGDGPVPPHPSARPAGPVPHAGGPVPRGGGPLPPPARPLARRLVAPVATLAGVAAAFAYVGTVDPNEPGHYPVCPLLRFTGVLCPGCGGLRSAHAFVHGDLPAALGANALAVVGYGLFGVLVVLWLIRAFRGVPLRLAVSPAWWWGIGTVLALFTLVRNLPFGSALAP